MRFLLASAVLFGLTQNAVAYRAAKPLEAEAIQSQIDKVNAATESLRSQRLALANAGREEAPAIRNEIARLSKIQKEAGEHAMWLTIRAFGILKFEGNVPVYPHGRSVLFSPEEKKDIRWMPIFEDEGIKNLQNAAGQPDGVRTATKKVAGNTASDGVSRIFPAAFDTPATLASVIIHEKIHFRQNTTPGKSDKKTTAELEVEAYEEELRPVNDPRNELGYSDDEKAAQTDNLMGILEGGKGQKGKRELAREERAIADRNYMGIPLPERSQLSHTEEELRKLVRQAKEQVVIAQKDHDTRLYFSWLDLARRSCDVPGSVTQDELDNLPLPNKSDFVQDVPYPLDQRPCMQVYYYLAGGGRNADVVRSKAIPPVQYLPAIPRQPRRFSSIFPEMRDFAVAACRNLNNTPSIERLYGEYVVEYFEADNNLFLAMAVGLDNCPRQLFKRMIERTRDSGGNFSLDRQWIENVILANPNPPPPPPPVYRPVEPPVPPPGGNPPCSPENGVWGCPKAVRE